MPKLLDLLFLARDMISVDHVCFESRRERVCYLAQEFRSYLEGPVLDVGCDIRVLPELIPELDYTGMDVSGAPDIELNLEEVERLPFDSGAFACVVCLDTLEHLDNLHQIFAEMVRVTARYLIVSFPNNWCNARRPIERGEGSIGHYGLPAQPPDDRHKWFFGLSEAAEFARRQAQEVPLCILRMIANEKPRPLVVRMARRLRYPVLRRYLNRYAHTLWVVFEKH